MKTLYLVRHAKSDWGDPSLSDFDRPLNDRGKRDAPVMAQRLLDKGIKIDIFISSPAKRAKKTAQIIAAAYMREKDDILLKEELYEPSLAAFMNVVSNIDDKFKHAAVFSHNYSLTDFANTLTNVRVDNIPTCGIFAVKIDCKSWKDAAEAEKEFLFFDFPKNG